MTKTGSVVHGEVSLLRMIANNWQGMVALGGAFFAGTILMGTMSGFVGLPALHRADIEALDKRIAPIELYIQEQRVLICIQTKQALGEPIGACTIRP